MHDIKSEEGLEVIQGWNRTAAAAAVSGQVQQGLLVAPGPACLQ